jgi:hypothetical protein
MFSRCYMRKGSRGLWDKRIFASRFFLLILFVIPDFLPVTSDCQIPNRPLRYRHGDSEIRSPVCPAFASRASWPDLTRDTEPDYLRIRCGGCELAEGGEEGKMGAGKSAGKGGQLPGTKWMICPVLTDWDLVRTRQELLSFFPAGHA